jgi:hypothetical protein
MIHAAEQSCVRRRRVRAQPGRPGVISVTAGWGSERGDRPLRRRARGSPIVCAGQHRHEDQPDPPGAYGADICQTSEVREARPRWSTIALDVRMAFRGDERTSAVVDIPTNVLYEQGDVASTRRRARLPAGALRSAAIRRRSSARSRRSRAPSVRWSSRATASSGPMRRPSCARWRRGSRYPSTRVARDRARSRRTTRSRCAARGRSPSPRAPT